MCRIKREALDNLIRLRHQILRRSFSPQYFHVSNYGVDWLISCPGSYDNTSRYYSHLLNFIIMNIVHAFSLLSNYFVLNQICSSFIGKCASHLHKFLQPGPHWGLCPQTPISPIDSHYIPRSPIYVEAGRPLYFTLRLFLLLFSYFNQRSRKRLGTALTNFRSKSCGGWNRTSLSQIPKIPSWGELGSNRGQKFHGLSRFTTADSQILTWADWSPLPHSDP